MRSESSERAEKWKAFHSVPLKRGRHRGHRPQKRVAKTVGPDRTCLRTIKIPLYQILEDSTVVGCRAGTPRRSTHRSLSLVHLRVGDSFKNFSFKSLLHRSLLTVARLSPSHTIPFASIRRYGHSRHALVDPPLKASKVAISRIGAKN